VAQDLQQLVVEASGALGEAEAVDQQRQPASCISLEAEVPEVLFDGMREFIRHHPQWDQYRLISAALANFLFQNGSQEPSVTQQYLNGLFRR
jgi:hypothetical protein